MNNSTFTNDIQFGTVSLEQHQTSKFVIYQIILPVVSVIGIVGNGLCFFVLADNKAKYAFATYLKALTIVDSCLLIGGLVPFILTSCKRFITNDEFLKLNNYVQLWVGRILGPLNMHVAGYFIVIISLERFVAVLYPLKVRSFVLEIYPTHVVIATIVFHVVKAIPAMVVLRAKSLIDPITNNTKYFIDRFYSSEEDKKVFSIYFTVMNFVNYFLPLLVVVCATTAIVISMRLKSVQKTTQGKWCMEKDKMTIVLVVIASFFAINNLIAVIMATVSVLNPQFIIKYPFAFDMAVDVLQVTICINSANDFAIYILSSTLFRQIFLRKFLFCGRSRDKIPDVTADGTADETVIPTDAETLEIVEGISGVISTDSVTLEIAEGNSVVISDIKLTV